ncbi:L-alanine-DL-glutamate epimerase-like enolase superfamily enzyme [Humitalea rosea]|uniref:L-alanine-DL-glutamate epimerase-like enolase superfamily enzyme n=1 Tax=Humitalea rosea TaxID=990373 RepID=A0A2W7IGE0_9PROT|nr:mandelate racemase/muconate lactonizing enzyme family protein [Humitalea rosea]PZW45646.1 L-alanine-DL-glutamate epimerase-like enolase superfamily enzyme [Humitalea rosea]
MAAVTIERIEAIPLRIPFDHWAPPPLYAGRPRTTLDTLLVRVTTNRGLIGWGEAFGGTWPATVAALDTWVTPLVLGQDATDPRIAARLERTLHNLGRSGPVMHAISGLDIALWDLRGKMEGVPVHALLGGKRRNQVPAYASLLQYYNDLGLIRTNVARALDRGYRQIKLHERTPEAVAATREVTGPGIPIMVDTNCAWTPDTVTEAVLSMAPSKPLWVEEPIWPPEDFASLAVLRQATGIPMAIGENATGTLDFEKMIAAKAVDYVQPSATKIGGLTPLWQIATHAEAHGVTCVPHAAYFGPGYLATLHALAAKPKESAIERFFCDLGLMPYAATVPVINGWVQVPDGPGLGAEPELELLERFRA